MCWDPRISGAREQLSALYEAVRQRDDRALDAFLKLATRELRGWLDRHFSRHRRLLDPLRIAEEAIEEVVLRSSYLSSWAHAWAYASRVAERAVRRAQRRETRACRLSLESLGVDVVDSHSGRFADAIDLDDALRAALAHLSLSELEILCATVRRTESLEALAEPLNVNVRTVKRWRRALRRKLRPVLTEE